MATRSPHAAIIGTSVSGLAAALALGLRGYTVTCFERDSTPMPRDHLDAFAKWDRRGAAQTRHSHVLLAPLVKLIKTHAADFYDRLLAAGAEELGFAELARTTFGDVALEPGDEDICFLACRRVVFEFLLRRYVAERHGVRILEGATVTGLLAEPGQPPRVTGVRIEQRSGTTELRADVVIDASGRHGAGDAWLAAIGAEPPEQQSSPCGIFYTSRFYRLKDGADYPELDGRKSTAGGVQGADLGYLKAGLFRADNRTFSVTLAADPEDKPMRAVSQERQFDIAATHIEATKVWVDPATSEPISKVYLYGNLSNMHKRFVRDDVPVALNYFAIGDAHVHTNPISGRGCALGWVSAFELADVLAAEPDAVKRALAFEARVDARILPWYRLQVGQDKQSIEIIKALQRGEDPYTFVRPDGSIDEAKQRLAVFRKGIGAAAREHVDVLRALFRHTNLLDLPDALFARQDLLGKILACYEQHKNEETKFGPIREEMLTLFAAAS
jgi:2-polyprenyl-6-methoxyphenol hydroxylase-like FAD-dependent oxidoreductase